MAASVYLGLGSNVGDRRAHLAHALDRLDAAFGLTGVSGVYETDPVGYRDQPRFLNLVARLRTDLAPRALLDRLRAIERERGRERTFKNAPRTLDIDLLLYGDRVIDQEGLRVPHPRMTERSFVLVPLLELDPELTHPVSGQAFHGLEAASPSEEMKRVMAGEELLDANHG